MRCVGYRQVWRQEGLYGKPEMRDRGIYATRQLAKRQITWLGNGFPPSHLTTVSTGLTDKVERTRPFSGL